MDAAESALLTSSLVAIFSMLPGHRVPGRQFMIVVTGLTSA